jgi:4-hydroxy-tetrahydrodipicolinate reductase
MIRVIHLGLGEIGKQTILALTAQKPAVKVVGAVDIHPDCIGKNLRKIMHRTDVPSLLVSGSIQEALATSGGADVATVTTGSRVSTIRNTLDELIRAGIHVVSSCEELAYPTLHAPKETAALDRAAKKKGVAILGTGVNPGFAMDAFALACTAPCTAVTHIKVIRSLDASKRREQLQKKIGAGMTVKDVKALIRQGNIGHVGLRESVAMIAAGLGWKLQEIREQFHPVVADHPVSSDYFHIQPGQVRGMWMLAQGIVNNKARIELDLMMAFDADTFDEVIIDGPPPLPTPLVIRTKGGFPGEASTVGMMANCVRIVANLKPGVRTMLDAFQVRSLGR